MDDFACNQFWQKQPWLSHRYCLQENIDTWHGDNHHPAFIFHTSFDGLDCYIHNDIRKVKMRAVLCYVVIQRSSDFV